MYIINGNKKIDFFIQSIINFKIYYKTSHKIKGRNSLKKEKEKELKESKQNILNGKKNKKSKKKVINHLIHLKKKYHKKYKLSS